MVQSADEPAVCDLLALSGPILGHRIIVWCISPPKSEQDHQPERESSKTGTSCVVFGHWFKLSQIHDFPTIISVVKITPMLIPDAFDGVTSSVDAKNRASMFFFLEK